MENYRVVVWDRRKMKVTQKLEAASPYNFFLTTITDSKPTHNDMLSISFPELLDPTLGNLESSLQVNFMVEFGWLLAQYHIMGHRGKPLTLLYGETDMELSDRFKNFLTHVKVVPPSPFGSHHTKMMVMAYTDGSIRVVVATANLVESDWDNRTQGLWMSEKLPKLSDSADTGSGDSPTNFKRDLIRYLSSYQLPELTSWIGKLKRADMSKVNVFFIASIPGKHVGVNLTNWGQMALKTTLRDYLTIPKGAETYPVIVQTSSIGSLGPKPESWLLGDMLQTFTAGKKLQPGPVSRPDLKFIYPSFENVAKSYDGLLGGGCLPYSKKTHSKQEWLTSFMCQWMSDCRDRTRAPPHIKTYCRVSPDMSHLSYFLLTSANLSKAAWGSLTCAGSSLNILSYEAGVLMLPQFVVGEDFFPLKKSEGCDTPIFPMPYDLPTKPYSFSDVPWFFENLS
ncbi:hypothetical protein AAG570_003672 [Ranatra chinensis]|uniref:Tyrosyl-DNA phosphodiesterase n=1 Tax=Ranatra chinensis TaxID=642074 RepID=A0ABD0Y4R2_9HEMI